MKIYVAGISGEDQHVNSLKSFYKIRLEPGDNRVERASGRGDVARRLACDEFLKGDYDAIALFDLDMLHNPNILTRFRKYNFDMVTGHYYARNGRTYVFMSGNTNAAGSSSCLCISCRAQLPWSVASIHTGTTGLNRRHFALHVPA